MNCRHYLFGMVASSTLVALSLYSLPAQALPIEGTTSGVFVNPFPDGATATGTGTNNFTFGDATDLETGPNRFSFEAVPFDIETETEFLIGTFSYFNGTTSSGTSINSVKLQLDLDFTTPSVGVQPSSFILNAIQTPNVGTPDENADAVLLPSSFSATVFTLDNTEYTLQLLGFDNVVGDGFLTSTNTRLNVREGSTASAQLFGRVTAELPDNLTSVPEPASILSLLGITPCALLLCRKA